MSDRPIGSAAIGEARLHIVRDAAGTTLSLGQPQAQWLLDQKMIERTSYEQTAPGGALCRYAPTAERTVRELNEAVLSVPELRECDFCRALGAAWKVNVRPFKLTQHSPAAGRFERPVYVCEECVPLVRATDKSALIDRMIEKTYLHALDHGGQIAAHATKLGPDQVRRGLLPATREFVTAVFHNRQGFPEKT